MLITKGDVAHFHQHGWVTVQTGLDKSSLDRYADKLRAMRASAIASDYQFRRVWWDYIDSDNVAALELPFNKAICDEDVYELFLRIDLGAAVNELMGWADSYCSLARLFCMNNYNYRGNWHRDLDRYVPESSALDSLQVGIYVQDQPGFRLLKKEYDAKFFVNHGVEKLFIDYYFPLDLPKESYVEAVGKAGSILLFNPSLFHQGSSFNERLDFHMRFLSKERCPSKHPLVFNEKLKFSTYDYLSVDFDASKLSDHAGIPKEARNGAIRRFVNSVNYKTGALNMIRWMRNRRAYSTLKRTLPVHTDFWANTQFQK